VTSRLQQELLLSNIRTAKRRSVDGNTQCCLGDIRQQVCADAPQLRVAVDEFVEHGFGIAMNAVDEIDVAARRVADHSGKAGTKHQSSGRQVKVFVFVHAVLLAVLVCAALLSRVLA
jgi:hypothetical protein